MVTYTHMYVSMSSDRKIVERVGSRLGLYAYTDQISNIIITAAVRYNNILYWFIFFFREQSSRTTV